jgi:hypothetical protein
VDVARRAAYALGLVLAAAPLWVGRHLPMVDLPQHLYLISVLHRLDDPTTLYPQVFAIRGQLTPYLGYYYLVSALNWLFPLTVANKLFLTAYVVGLPLSLAFLLRSLGRPRWPSLLAVPFAYGDSFGWGFVNYLSAIPLAFLCCAFLVRTLSDSQRRGWAIGLCLSLTAVLLFHVQVFAFLGIALPALLLMTSVPDDKTRKGTLLKPRVLAILAVVPAALLFLVWVGLRLGEPATVEYGAPWKAWGPLLSAQNLSYKSFAQNWDDLFQVLANILRDQSDRYALYAVGAICIACVVIAALQGASKSPRREGSVERWRMVVLAVVALAMYIALPFDVRGYMYYLNTRFAHLAAPLAVGALPILASRFRGYFLGAAALTTLVLAIPLVRGFSAFDDEALSLDRLAPLAGSRPMVMGLIFDTSSRAVRHPVFLHSAAVIARERGGVPNFTFALTPHSPLKYRGSPPPTFPSEWRPDQFNYQREGLAYQDFLFRGVTPSQVFGARLGKELSIAGQMGGFWLVSRR